MSKRKRLGLGRIGPGHQRVAAVGRHQRQDRIARVGRIAGEVDAREQPLQHAAREHADIDVRRLRACRRGPARCPGLMVAKWNVPSLAVGAAAEAAEGVGRERPAVGGMGIAALDGRPARVSISASGSALPSPSSTRPSMRMCVPGMPASATPGREDLAHAVVALREADVQDTARRSAMACAQAWSGSPAAWRCGPRSTMSKL